MVLVTVGDENTADFVYVVYKVGKIGDNQVNAQHIVIGEADTAVDNYNVLAAFDNRDVLSDFVKTAQGENLNAWLWLFLGCLALLRRLALHFALAGGLLFLFSLDLSCACSAL